MTKKVIKISLCIVALFGLSLSFIYSIINTSTTALYNEIWSTTVGFPSNHSLHINNLTSTKPYTYINIPKSPDIPLALTVNTHFNNNTEQPPNDNNTNQGQDLPTNTGLPVIAFDMSEKQTVDLLLCKNDSKYSPDVNALAKKEYPLKFSKSVSTADNNAPVVLIIHTHGSECYLPENTYTYDENTPTRSYDITSNVVAVGKALADTLNANGVPTIHCETMFDAESYSDSYNLSEKAVLEYLEAYPSIQYVFDVHRDSVINASKEKVKPLTLLNDTPTAQAMFVVGTNSNGAVHPNWMDNLTVASIFQYKLVEDYQTLMRPINVRASSFNAEHTTGSILIEIGTCGNTLSEAKHCAVLLGQTISQVILNDGL